MRTDTPKTIYLKDYKPFPFEIESLNLDFDIHDGETFVTAITKYKKKDPATKEDLFLKLLWQAYNGETSHELL